MTGENPSQRHTRTISVATSDTIAELIQAGEYKLRLGYPDKINVLGYGPDDVTITTNPANPGKISTSVSAEFTPRAASEGVSYRITHKLLKETVDKTREKLPIDFGNLYIIDEAGDGRVDDKPAQKLSTNGFGISNKQTAKPILFRIKASSSGTTPEEESKEFQYWLPGTGIIDPPVPTIELYVWFQTSPEDKDGYKIDDQTIKFPVPFKAGEFEKTIWYLDTGIFDLNAPKKEEIG